MGQSKKKAVKKCPNKNVKKNKKNVDTKKNIWYISNAS